MEYGRLTGYFSTVIRSGSADITVPLSGFITVVAATSHLLLDHITILPTPVLVPLVDGTMTYAGHDYLELIATDSVNANPVSFLYRIIPELSYNGSPVRYDPFYVALPTGSEVDLASVAPVPNTITHGLIVGPPGPIGPGGTVSGDWYDEGPGEVEPDLALLFENTQL